MGFRQRNAFEGMQPSSREDLNLTKYDEKSVRPIGDYAYASAATDSVGAQGFASPVPDNSVIDSDVAPGFPLYPPPAPPLFVNTNPSLRDDTSGYAYDRPSQSYPRDRADAFGMRGSDRVEPRVPAEDPAPAYRPAAPVMQSAPQYAAPAPRFSSPSPVSGFATMQAQETHAEAIAENGFSSPLPKTTAERPLVFVSRDYRDMYIYEYSDRLEFYRRTENGMTYCNTEPKAK